jgi:hypothetical protein
MDDYIDFEHPFDDYLVEPEVSITSNVQAQIKAIEQNQPKYLEEVSRFNSTMTQNICIRKYPNDFVFSMV